MTDGGAGSSGPGGDDGSGATRLVVIGRVQGVGFRAWTRRIAHDLGVRGWVRNRPDGAVEIHAAAPPDTLERFHRLLREGPGYARVDEVREEGAPKELPMEGFLIRG